MGLNPGLSLEVYKPIADQLGFTPEKTAQGMLGIVIANMVRTIRTISVERGHDPRDFVLMPFGGAGPLHARDVAVSLGMKEMVVPAAPGIVCAQGLLVSDLKEDFVASRRIALDTAGLGALAETLEDLNAKALDWFKGESAPDTGRRVQLVVDARYVGQNFELAVPVAEGATLAAGDVPNIADMTAAFCAAHDQAYGYASETVPIEIVNVRLSASAKLHRFDDKPAPTADAGEPTVRDTRQVYFTEEAPVEAQIYDRAEMRPGQSVTGPAVIEQMDTTTPVYPGDLAEMTPDGHLIITINPEAKL